MSGWEPGSAEYYESLLSVEERAQHEREQEAARIAAAEAEEVRLAALEQGLAREGLDIFGRPLTAEPCESEPEAEL
jgi:hypothetical protein